MLRHACGFALANAGHDTRALQAYLGHRNIQHTVRYTELAPGRFRISGGPDEATPRRRRLTFGRGADVSATGAAKRVTGFAFTGRPAFSDPARNLSKVVTPPRESAPAFSENAPREYHLELRPLCPRLRRSPDTAECAGQAAACRCRPRRDLHPETAEARPPGPA